MRPHITYILRSVTMQRVSWTTLSACVGLCIPATAAAQASGGARDSISIAAASRAFSAAYMRNDTAALGQIYSDSAVLLPPNREIRGRRAIQRYFAWGQNYRQIAHSMESTRLTVEGDLAVDVGTWTSTGQRGDAAPTTASERYLVIWVRESDRAWRMLYDMWHRPARATQQDDTSALPVVTITGPTVIAFWEVPPSDSVLISDPDLASALDEQQYYWADTRTRLTEFGIMALSQPGRRFTVRDGTRERVFAAPRDSAVVGYLLVAPGRDFSAIYRVQYPDNLLAAVRSFFGLPDNP